MESDGKFDIVIPIGPNDIEIAAEQIKYTQKNVLNYRKIFIVTCVSDLNITGCTTVTEAIFPFTIETVAKVHGKRERNGWYLQQLLKLYAGFCIENILDRYLVIDCDTFFLKPIEFLSDNNQSLYNFGFEYHKPYFIHMKKMHEDFEKVVSESGICHHMMFEKRFLSEMMDMVEKKHNMPFYEAFLKNVTELDHSGASEYELYFNFILNRHATDIQIRKLNWVNSGTLNNEDKNIDYISYHWYLRT